MRLAGFADEGFGVICLAIERVKEYLPIVPWSDGVVKMDFMLLLDGDYAGFCLPARDPLAFKSS